MKNISKAVDAIITKNLNEMKNRFVSELDNKAKQALEEKRDSIAMSILDKR